MREQVPTSAGTEFISEDMLEDELSGMRKDFLYLAFHHAHYKSVWQRVSELKDHIRDLIRLEGSFVSLGPKQRKETLVRIKVVRAELREILEEKEKDAVTFLPAPPFSTCQ